jgi:hypothetical protein
MLDDGPPSPRRRMAATPPRFTPPSKRHLTWRSSPSRCW